MLNSLTIMIDREKISITAEDGSLLSRTFSLFALDQSGQIVGIGKPYEELRNQRNVRVFNPFLMEKFEPKYAAVIISKLLADAAKILVSQADEEARIISINCHIFIAGYENLDKRAQDSFEYYTEHLSHPKIKTLTITNQPKSIAEFRRAELAIKIGLVLTIFAVQWLIFRILQITIPEQMAKPLNFFGIVLNFVFYMCIVYFAGLMYIAICKVMMKNLIPAPVYKDMIEDTDLSPKRLLSLMRDKISSRQKGG